MAEISLEKSFCFIRVYIFCKSNDALSSKQDPGMVSMRLGTQGTGRSRVNHAEISVGRNGKNIWFDIAICWNGMMIKIEVKWSTI